MQKKTTTTTIKIDDRLYEDFKIMGIKTKMSLHDLVQRTMMLYLTEGDFRYKVHQTYNTYYTGSSLLDNIVNYK